VGRVPFSRLKVDDIADQQDWHSEWGQVSAQGGLRDLSRTKSRWWAASFNPVGTTAFAVVETAGRDSGIIPTVGR